GSAEGDRLLVGGVLAENAVSSERAAERGARREDTRVKCTVLDRRGLCAVEVHRILTVELHYVAHDGPRAVLGRPRMIGEAVEHKAVDQQGVGAAIGDPIPPVPADSSPDRIPRAPSYHVDPDAAALPRERPVATLGTRDVVRGLDVIRLEIVTRE